MIKIDRIEASGLSRRSRIRGTDYVLVMCRSIVEIKAAIGSKGDEAGGEPIYLMKGFADLLRGNE